MTTTIAMLAVTAVIGASSGGAPTTTKKATGAGAGAGASDIELWVRAVGSPDGDRPPRARSMTVSLDSLPLTTGERFDAQYGSRRAYRGIALGALLDRFAPEAGLDLAILHFSNGMAVPLPFRDAEVMKRLDPLVARGSAEPGKPVRAGEFPNISKQGAKADARPIRFLGNKIVVAERWHPAVAAAAQPAFSPWAHTDTLVDIELVESGPYYRQFDVGAAGTTPAGGLALFRQSCQFCHGVRKVGAKMGWDFVEPTPIYSYRKGTNLYYHVAFKPLDAAERGLLMPALGFMTKDEAAVLWQWLKTVANTPTHPYQPAARTASKRD